MQNVTLIALGRVQAGFMSDGCKEYIKRLTPFCNLKVIEIPEEQLNEKAISDALITKALDREAQKILSALPRQGYIIALCIEGKQLKSCELAQLFEKRATSGDSNITLIIGSSHGLSDKIKNMADLRLSFSLMTFPHQLARVIALEQIYRSFSIINNTKYHK